MIEKPKPCPFCGEKIEKRTGTVAMTTMFICRKCGADVCFFGAEDDPKATDAWNRRVNNA